MCGVVVGVLVLFDTCWDVCLSYTGRVSHLLTQLLAVTAAAAARHMVAVAGAAAEYGGNGSSRSERPAHRQTTMRTVFVQRTVAAKARTSLHYALKYPHKLSLGLLLLV